MPAISASFVTDSLSSSGSPRVLSANHDWYRIITLVKLMQKSDLSSHSDPTNTASDLAALPRNYMDGVLLLHVDLRSTYFMVRTL
jgi:hypothetical protein